MKLESSYTIRVERGLLHEYTFTNDGCHIENGDAWDGVHFNDGRLVAVCPVCQSEIDNIQEDDHCHTCHSNLDVVHDIPCHSTVKTSGRKMPIAVVPVVIVTILGAIATFVMLVVKP